ncbi:hypothetical protein OHA37_35055 [Streptomyces sp. NBC_00335]|uniref:hypothetical protein n=1 Tax=unclassified Streptomyces TaxID=2593676 RepID=UPI0022532725|nr:MULTISPECIES: hypothetical protein [unclassified Streptomyces]MCX5409061.1 hypothetical protein [Streptomyces sp. NBC_00086]
MMEAVLEEIRRFLPFSVTAVEADADGICLQGDRWRLRINSSWRVSEGGQITISPSLTREGSQSYGLEDLVGDEVVDVGIQGVQFRQDLYVVTREGRILEIFSDFPYGEWLLSISDVGDERRIPIFDLEGPASDVT